MSDAEGRAKLKVEVEGAREAAGDFGDFLQTAENSIEVFEAVAEVVGAVVDALVDAGEEWERQAGVLQTYSGSIENASRRMNGLVSDLDLMIARNRLAQAGLRITEQDLGNLGVAADSFADAVGGDTTQALDQLVGALVSGRTRGLRPFGLELEEGAERAEVQAAALDQLNERFGDSEAQAATLAGELLTLGTRVDNLETEFFQAITASEGINAAWAEMKTAADQLAAALLGPATGITYMDATVGALTATVQVAAAQLQRFATLASQIRSGDFAGAIRTGAQIADPANSVGRILDLAPGATLDARNRRRAGAAAGGEGGRTLSPGGGGGGGGGSRSTRGGRRALAEGTIAEQGLGRIAAGAEADVDAYEDYIERLTEFREDYHELETDLATQADELDQLLYEQRMDRLERERQVRAEAFDTFVEQERKRRDLIVETGQQSIAITLELAQAVIESGWEGLKATGKRLAIEEAWRALQAFAFAPLLFWIEGPGAMKDAIQSGIQHSVLAGIAGAGAGIGAAGARGGGGRGGGGARGAESGLRPIPRTEGRRDREPAQLVINVNTGQALATTRDIEAAVGDAVNRASRDGWRIDRRALPAGRT